MSCNAAKHREALPVHHGSAWLLRVGWKKHGLLDPAAVPGPLR